VPQATTAGSIRATEKPRQQSGVVVVVRLHRQRRVDRVTPPLACDLDPQALRAAAHRQAPTAVVAVAAGGRLAVVLEAAGLGIAVALVRVPLQADQLAHLRRDFGHHHEVQCSPDQVCTWRRMPAAPAREVRFFSSIWSSRRSRAARVVVPDLDSSCSFPVAVMPDCGNCSVTWRRLGVGHRRPRMAGRHARRKRRACGEQGAASGDRVI